MVLETTHPAAGPLRQIGVPLTDANALAPAPAVGEHTESVLQELGYGSDDIATLRGSGVI